MFLFRSSIYLEHYIVIQVYTKLRENLFSFYMLISKTKITEKFVKKIVKKLSHSLKTLCYGYTSLRLFHCVPTAYFTETRGPSLPKKIKYCQEKNFGTSRQVDLGCGYQYIHIIIVTLSGILYHIE